MHDAGMCIIALAHLDIEVPARKDLRRHNLTPSLTFAHAQEAQDTLERVNRHGWEIWADDEPATDLGIPALIMNHIPDERRASSEQMARVLSLPLSSVTFCTCTGGRDGQAARKGQRGTEEESMKEVLCMCW